MHLGHTHAHTLINTHAHTSDLNKYGLRLAIVAACESEAI